MASTIRTSSTPRPPSTSPFAHDQALSVQLTECLDCDDDIALTLLGADEVDDEWAEVEAEGWTTPGPEHRSACLGGRRRRRFLVRWFARS